VNETGRELRKVDVDETVFGIQPNMAVLHQAFVTQRANQRGGNAKTKTRGEVQGSTRKVHRQKTTGQARAGTNRSPIRVGGGRAFGPRPRSYAKDFPKKMRRLAIRSALSGKVADGQLVVIDQLAMEMPKTKRMMRLLENVGFNRSALVVTGSADRMVLASLRNLDKTKTLPAAYLNVVDMMNHAGLLMTEEAVRVAERLWGKKEPTNGVRPARRQRKPEPLAVTSEKPVAPSRRSRADIEGAPPAAQAAAEETAPTGRKTRFVPKTPKTEAEAAEPEATTQPEAVAAPEATAPAKPRRGAKPEATGEPEPKPARAPKTKATTDVKAKAAPKPRATRAEAKPEAKHDAESKPAPKARATRAKAKPAADAAKDVPKPRKRTPKKTEEGE
jgi:large subunit ribosomal protein L4